MPIHVHRECGIGVAEATADHVDVSIGLDPVRAVVWRNVWKVTSPSSSIPLFRRTFLRVRIRFDWLHGAPTTVQKTRSDTCQAEVQEEVVLPLVKHL